MRCQQAKNLIFDPARGTASPAEQAALEDHIGSCADCRKEQSHWLLLKRLGKQPPPGLSAEAQRLMLQRLIRQAQSTAVTKASAASASSWRWPTLAFAAAALFVLLFWRGERNHSSQSGTSAQAPVQLSASADGTIHMSGARVSYLSGTALRIDDERREVVLEKGEVDVDVTHAKEPAGSRFRVRTDRFVVEVFGTRFRVTPTAVVTLRGRVKVLGLDGKELAVLGAGDRFQYAATAPTLTIGPLPEKVVSPAHTESIEIPQPEAPPTPPSAPPETHAPPAARPAAVPTPIRPVAQSVRTKLALARTALADGDLALARLRIADAWKSEPTKNQQAALALLEADCLLGERRYAEAIFAYRQVAAKYPTDASGETAAFALAQLLSERGSGDEARAALESYLTNYPSGRFVREAQEKLHRQTEKRTQQP